LTNKKFDGAASTPVGFTHEDTFITGMHFLTQAFNKAEKASDLLPDADYGPKVRFNLFSLDY
jgi:hypothetical protein